MAQLLLINEATHIEGLNEIGDVVVIHPDAYKPNITEEKNFDIVRVDLTFEEINTVRPEMEVVEDKSILELPPKFYWRDAVGGFRELKKQPTYRLHYDTKTKILSENFSKIVDNLGAIAIIGDR